MNRRSLGVVIARFQAPALTQAHQYLLEQVATRVGRVLVLLGVAPIPLTKRNPLEYSLRARMVQDWWEENYPDRATDLHVAPLLDKPTDGEWAAGVDGLIAAMNINGPAVVYCGPDGAGPYYQKAGGKWPIEVLDAAGGHASKIRYELGPHYDEGFRSGIVYALERRRVLPQVAVDVIITDRVGADNYYLLAHKNEDGQHWRFVGGFLDVGETLEQAVSREVMEETGLEVGNHQYLGSFPIDDWRFRGGPEGVTSALFSTQKVWGSPRAADDIDDLHWYSGREVAAKIHPIHKPLWEVFES